MTRAGIALVVVLFSLVAYRLLFPRTLADDANDVLYAVWNGDGRTLYRFVDPAEIQALGWTPEKLDGAMKAIARPVFAQCKDFTPTKKLVNGNRMNPSQGAAQARVTLPDGSTVSISGMATASDEGGKTTGIGQILFAWWVGYLVRHPHEHRTLATNYKATLEGYARDRAVLAQLGIPGVYDDSKRELVPWDVFISGRQSELANYEAGNR